MNNLRHIFLIILWITSLGTQAQTTFEKLYSYPLKQIGVQGIQLSQGYLISTKIDDCGPCDGYIQFIRIDDSGDTIRTFNIPNLGNEQGPVSTLFLNDQHLVIAANNTNGITNQVALINSDTLGNIFWSYVLSDPLYDYSANAMIKIDSNYLITGMRSVPGSPQLTRTFLLSVSKAGNFNWLNSYGNPYEFSLLFLKQTLREICFSSMKSSWHQMQHQQELPEMLSQIMFTAILSTHFKT